MYVLSNGKDQTAKLWDLRKMMAGRVDCRGLVNRQTSNWDYRFMTYPVPWIGMLCCRVLSSFEAIYHGDNIQYLPYPTPLAGTFKVGFLGRSYDAGIPTVCEKALSQVLFKSRSGVSLL